MNSTPINIVNPEELYKPICVACDERGEYTLATEERHGEPYCSNCAQNRDEAAYERSLSDFYGGSGACTDRERMDAAYALDRSQK